MSKVWRVASVFVALILAVYFVYFAVKAVDFQMLGDVVYTPQVALAVVVGSVLYALIVPISAWAWQKLLAVQGENWRIVRLIIILGLAQFAKYVPGNVAQHAARVAMSVRSGMSIGPYVTSVTQETLLAVFASLIVGMATLLLAGGSLAQLSPQATAALVVAGVGLAGVVLVLSSVRLDPGTLRVRSNPVWRVLARMGGLPGPKVVLSTLSAYAVNYLVIGIGLWLVARAMGVGESMGYLAVTSAFALSWMLGFMVPGAPAGFGAREGIMLMLLQGSAENESVVAFVLLARVITLLGDLICFTGAGAVRASCGKLGVMNG